MRALAVVLALVAAGCAPGTSSTPKTGSSMPASIIDPYLKIQTALANDSIDSVRAHAGNIATAATSLGSPALKIDMAAIQLAATTQIADMHDRFGALSEALVAYMDGLQLAAPEGVRVAFCPMKMKPWLQEGSTLTNPYYGSSMSTCGSFR